MKIGVISDTHDHLDHICKALAVFQKHNIQHLFHCGDITSLSSIQMFSEFPLAVSFGNGDILTGEIKRFLKVSNPANQASQRIEMEIDGKRIGMTHSHLQNELARMIESQAYDLIFYGHTHLRSSKLIGNTRVINPGAIGGMLKQPPGVCILDLDEDTVIFEEIT